MAVQISGNDITVPRDGSFTRNVTIGGTLTYEDVTNIDSVGLVTARNGIEIGARPGVAASISVDGNMIVSGVTTFTPGGSEIVRINSGGLLVYNDVSFFGASTHAYWDSSANQFALNDNTKLSVGNSSDLSIYHDGTKSIINESGTGWLEINTNNLRVQNAAANETLLYATENGRVQLMHDNSKKLETSSNGVTVTGTVTADGLVLSDNDEIQFGNSTDFRIYHDSNNSYIRDVGTGSLSISGSQVSFDSSNLAEYMVRAIEDGAVELYHNGVKKLETTSSGVTITGNILAAGTNADIKIEAVGSGGHVKFRTTGSDRWYVEGTNGDFLPQADNTYDIGNSSYRVANIYTNDLHCSNKGSSNDVDGTWGDYTIQEGESDLFLINNRSGKKYKFNLTEVS